MGLNDEVMVYSRTKTADQIVVTMQRLAMSPQVCKPASGGRASQLTVHDVMAVHE